VPPAQMSEAQVLPSEMRKCRPDLWRRPHLWLCSDLRLWIIRIDRLPA